MIIDQILDMRDAGATAIDQDGIEYLISMAQLHERWGLESALKRGDQKAITRELLDYVDQEWPGVRVKAFIRRTRWTPAIA